MTVTPVPFSLSEGKEIIVSGVNSPGCERFEINLMGGPDYSDGTALHFNPRFEDSQVVRNHYTDAWGEEERDGDFPFTADQPFEIRIAVKESGYTIYVDGTYFCDFNHRLPKDAVKSVYLLNVESADVAFNNTIYPVPFPLSEGIEISVKARVRPNCSSIGYGRFAIDLSSLLDSNTDIQLHFNPRFEENQVVRNHFTGGSWGEEERHGDFPFSLGDSFEVKIAVKDSHFQISINGSHFCDFNHRLPKEDVKFVTVNGGIDSSKVSFLKKIENPSVPFLTPIQGEFIPGRKITIKGKPLPDVERFSVNLQCGDDQDSSDLALHYDARLNYGSDQNVVVRNHRSDGNFGPEEKDQDFFPFSADAPFELVIVVEAENYTVLVNGQQHVVFNHRIIPIQRVNHLSILGDVELQEVHIE